MNKAKEILQKHCDEPINGVGLYDTGFSDRDIARQVLNAMQEYAEFYHISKLSNVVGLPTDEEIEKRAAPMGFPERVKISISSAQWMRSEASKVIAALQEEINQLKKINNDGNN